MEVMKLTASLPQPVYSANQVLSNEAAAADAKGVPLFELMKSAGRAAFELLSQQAEQASSVLIVAGKGNNGGDGYVLARHCAAAGFMVSLLVLADEEKITGDAAKALTMLDPDSVNLRFEPDLAKANKMIAAFEGDWLVDAIFGIGLKGKLTRAWQQLLTTINEHYSQIISLDIPSGLCATTGHVENVAVAADFTVTFIVLKQGLLTGKAANYIGDLWLATLDVQTEFVQTIPAQAFAQGTSGLPAITPRRPTIHKGSIGLVLAMGGNLGMPGAIRMAAESSLRTGASLVAVACHQENQAIVVQGRPELMLAPSEPERLISSSFVEKAKVILIGPGLGRDAWANQLMQAALKADKPMVVDADALFAMKSLRAFSNNWVLTPHPGEAAFLLDCDIATIEADRFGAVTAIAQKYGGICVLKGAGSLIGDGQKVIVNTTGNAGMASGGMGDVLSGIIAALILQTGSMMDATRLAVSIHGQAAELVTQNIGMRGLLASDLFEPIRQLVNQY
ncbi:NAD(P)H-hydrate dehydratase [Thalassotalea montiporae]